ncbi:MAG: stage II sporulation protein R [Desulfocucumaceae bacterium]
MKKFVCGLLLALAAVAAVGLLGAGWGKDNLDPAKLIRFHVIANSDTVADQALKLKVRDGVIKAMSPVLTGAGDVEEARKRVDENIGLMASAATGVLNENGSHYPVRVVRGNFEFPEKSYRISSEGGKETERITLSAGEYEAVRVIIGEGKGANWWCVLFPPLCFVNPADSAGGDQKTPAAGENSQSDIPAFKYDNIPPEVVEGSKVEYRFKVVDWYMRVKEII